MNNFSRWPKTIHQSNFKQEYIDLIILLSRVCGLKDSTNFELWMYKFISLIIRTKQKIFWEEMINDIVCKQLSKVTSTSTFYMNSYMCTL